MQAKALYQRYRELIDSESDTTEEIAWVTKELKKKVGFIELDLEDLEKTIEIVEGDLNKWNITATELKNRKVFVATSKREVQVCHFLKKIKDEALGKAAEQKLQRKQKEKLTSSKTTVAKDKYAKLDEAIVQDNQEFIDQQLLEQRKEIEDQDAQLDIAIAALGRIQNIAQDIGDELDTQKTELIRLQSDVDKTQNFLKRTQQRLDKLMRNSSDKGKLIAVVILVICLAVLVILLFTVV